MLRIPSDIHRSMLTHAAAELPNECCGLLAGVDGGVTHHFPLVNALASPTEFESNSRSMLAAHKAMRAAGIDVLAVYHSHPTGEPIPSRRDLERNYSEGVVNLIVGWVGDETVMRGWHLSTDGAREADWGII